MVLHRTTPSFTTLGSVPHPDAEDALAFVHATSPEFPTWPQLSQGTPPEPLGDAFFRILPGALPTNGGGILLEVPTGITVTDWDVDLHRAREAEEAFSRFALGYSAFRDQLSQGDFGRRPRVKSPLVGPITLASLLTLADGRSALDDPATCDRLARLVAMLGVAMAVELRELGAGEVDVWLDEPSWGKGVIAGALDHAWRSRYRALITTMHAADITVGIHCCAGVDFEAFAELGLDILSFDAAHYLDELLAAMQILAPEIQRGNLHIAWGIIDTWAPDVEVDIATVHHHWRETIATLPPDLSAALLANPIFTPACGLGLLTVEQAESTMSRLHEFVQLFVS